MKEIILVGNPNVGKTTIFNALTKSDEHTGNWHGVTVADKKKKYVFNKQQYDVVDLPGIYSLTPLSFEEEVSVKYLYQHKDYVILNIVDAENLNRNLYLTYELLLTNLPMIMVVNTMGEINNITNNNIEKLKKILGINVVVFDEKNTNNINELKTAIQNFEMIKNKKNIKNGLNFSEKLQKNIQEVEKLINFDANKINLSKEYINFKLLQNDDLIIYMASLDDENKLKLNQIQKEISLEEIAANTYKNVDKILTFSGLLNKHKIYGKSKIDKIVLNKYLALPIFFAVLFIIFYFTFFSVGKYLGGALSSLVQNGIGQWIVNAVKGITNSPIITDFFETAIIGGVGSVLSFLPQVVILFLCLGVLEDSGYLSRVAFCLDDVFSKVGLSGKSVYTLLMGFGCSTSACMTARTMDDKNSKIKTAMLAPYMSCTAKLPIYAVIGSAFFGASNVFVIFAMYMLGVLVALLLSVFYEKTILPSGKNSFILEFPKYRKITLKRFMDICATSTKQFLIRVGSVLVSVNIIVWGLSSFSFGFRFVKFVGGVSILESLGKIISPIFAPLGFGSWGACSALLAGLIAKEVIISTIAMVNGVSASSDYNGNISKSLTLPNSAIYFTPASAISYMVFCLLYSPCLATISVLSREIGKKWLIFACFIQFFVAYVVSMLIYACVNLVFAKGVLTLIFIAIFVVLLLFSLIFLVKKNKSNHMCVCCKKCK